MEKKTLWKRFGDWLRRSPQHEETSSSPLNEDGLLVDRDQEAGEDAEARGGGPLMRNTRKNQALAMEDGFNRLVEALEAINENVVQQRQVGEDLRRSLASLPEFTRKLPDTLEAQKNLTREILEQVRRQSEEYQRLSETLSELPEASDNQLQQLEAIARQLTANAQTESQMAQAFEQVDANVGRLAEANQAQVETIGRMGELFAENQKQVQQLLTRQNRRFFWGLAAALLATAAFVVLAALLYRAIQS